MPSRKSGGWLEQIAGVSYAPLLINPVSLVVLFMVGAVFLSISLWNKYHHKIHLAANAPLSTETLLTTPLPNWIKTNIEQEAIQQSRLDQIQLTHPAAIQKAVEAFAVHPWVDSVNRAKKESNGIWLDLIYRRPVAMVEVLQDRWVFIPVDRNAIALEGEQFSEFERGQYLHISVLNPNLASLSIGTAWNDLRIRDAAQIAYACEGVWRSLGMVRIFNESGPTNDPMRMTPFVLMTRQGTSVIWGRAPGKELTGEATAREKLEAMVAFVEANGPLDQTGVRVFDVVDGKMKPSKATVAWEVFEASRRK